MQILFGTFLKTLIMAKFLSTIVKLAFALAFVIVGYNFF